MDKKITFGVLSNIGVQKGGGGLMGVLPTPVLASRLVSGNALSARTREGNLQNICASRKYLVIFNNSRQKKLIKNMHISRHNLGRSN